LQAENDGADVGGVLRAVNAELGGRRQVERRLTGGWNEGAYLLRGDDGLRVVLKWRPGDPERLPVLRPNEVICVSIGMAFMAIGALDRQSPDSTAALTLSRRASSIRS
jgi:hypothetical protein